MDSARAFPATGATVCFVRRAGKVLLRERTADRIWAGRLNGPGGKIDAGETPESAVVREVAEETGLRLDAPVPHSESSPSTGSGRTCATGCRLSSTAAP